MLKKYRNFSKFYIRSDIVAIAVVYVQMYRRLRAVTMMMQFEFLVCEFQIRRHRQQGPHHLMAVRQVADSFTRMERAGMMGVGSASVTTAVRCAPSFPVRYLTANNPSYGQTSAVRSVSVSIFFQRCLARKKLSESSAIVCDFVEFGTFLSKGKEKK